MNIVEAFGAIPTAEDEKVRVGCAVRDIFEEGRGVVGSLLGRDAVGLDGTPGVAFNVECVKVVEIFTSVPSPKYVDFATRGDEVGRVHIAWTRWGS